MARKISKKTKKKIVKAAKKYPVFTAVVILLVVVIVGCCLLHSYGYIHIPFLDGVIPPISSSDDSSDSSGGDIITDDLSIHFLQLGNSSPGDSTLIKTGTTEILIDAGSTKGSAETIVPYIQQYCTDGILEYVITTHADTDHIAAFIGTTTYDGVLESFICQTIIDNKSVATTQMYADYVALRDAEVAAGAKHYTAIDCWNNKNGAQRSFTIAEDITLNILYQKYYEEYTSNENDNSVCVMISQGTNHYLFTGDLETAGETSLVERNTLPKCKLYKAGHHGSDTSSNIALLQKIQPEIVAVNCCSGGKHNFPTQPFIDRIAVYTDKVYVTTVTAENANNYLPMNGNIVVSSNGGAVTVNCSNNNILLKDTEWFAQNRTCPEQWET